MPVLIDVNEEQDVEVIDETKGIPLTLSKEQLEKVVLTKYVSVENEVADWQPANEWIEQITADIPGRRDRLQVEGLDGEPKRLGTDDGLIVTLAGTQEGLVGILPGRPALSEDEAEEYMDMSGEAVPMFQKWNFRIDEILRTNGPEGREMLSRSEDQKRQSSQSEMYDTIASAFKEGLLSLNQAGNLAPTADAVLKAAKEKK